MATRKKQAVVMDAVVSQALPNAMFEVELEDGHKLIAYAAGRMRRYFIRITPGDRIRVELSPYDLSRGRIVYRYREYGCPASSRPSARARVFDLEQPRYAGAPIAPGARCPGFNYFLHRHHAPRRARGRAPARPASS